MHDMLPYGDHNTKTGTWENPTPTVSIMFSIVFPGFTGILAGANLSGDIRNARENIAKGTLLSLLVTVLIYVVISLVLAMTVQRAHLVENFLIMENVVEHSIPDFPIVYIGICCTTLSSAFSYLLGAPRILQALAKDRVFGFLVPFAYGGGTSPSSRSRNGEALGDSGGRGGRRGGGGQAAGGDGGGDGEGGGDVAFLSNRLLSSGGDGSEEGLDTSVGSMDDSLYDEDDVDGDGRAISTASFRTTSTGSIGGGGGVRGDGGEREGGMLPEHDPEIGLLRGGNDDDAVGNNKGSGRCCAGGCTADHRAPRRAIVLTWFLAQLVIFVGDLNLLAPILSSCFLLTFCVINLACFMMEISPVEFNPHFQMYSKYSAFVGVLFSMAATFSSPGLYFTGGLSVLLLAVLYWKRRTLLRDLRLDKSQVRV
jgi:hypothetical protein